MFACRWFEVVVLVSSVARTAHSSVGPEVPFELSRDLSQADVELILNAQTILRRHFIKSLADVRGKITGAEGLDAVVGGIIQDLQTRNLDPFKLLRYTNSSEEQLAASLKADALNYFQGGGHSPVFIDWSFFLQTNERLDIQLRPEHLQKIQDLGEPFVDFVLRGIHKNDIKANSKLFADVLYNFRFREHTPELSVILENINQILSENLENLLDFQTDAAEVKHPDDVLADILKFISLKEPSHVRLVYLINQLLSGLSGSVQVKDTSELWRLFDLMQADDYPPDVIRAKNVLSSAIRNNQVGVDLSGVNENVKGNPPMEKLLMLMAELSGHSFFQREVHAVYPHVKLRYLTSKGQFFRPRTAVDVTFLLKSFLTVKSEMNPMIVEEVERIFFLSHWEEIFKKFDFSRYSSPRPLVVDMIQGLLNESDQLPLCSVILLRYFLTNNRQVSRCTADDVHKELISPSASSFQDNYPTGVPLKASPSSLPSSPALFVTSPSRPPDPEGSHQLSSVALPAWTSTTTILPFSISRNSSQLLSSMTDTILSVSAPSVGTALPDSPTTSTSPPQAPCQSPESSADSQCRPSTVKNILEATLSPLHRLDDTTPIDSVEQEFTSATEIHSATAITRLSTGPIAMEHDETTSVTTHQKEKASDEYLMSGTSVYVGETTSPENSSATT